jgi:hypothetical protein
MSLDDPARVVHSLLAKHTLLLQRESDVKRHVAPREHTSDLLKDFAQE